MGYVEVGKASVEEQVEHDEYAEHLAVRPPQSLVRGLGRTDLVCRIGAYGKCHRVPKAVIDLAFAPKQRSGRPARRQSDRGSPAEG